MLVHQQDLQLKQQHQLCPVILKYAAIFSSNGKTDVVAPISAPILQIVPLPVHEIVPAPSPKYSTIAPVPPLTVRIPASFKITSFGRSPARHFSS